MPMRSHVVAEALRAVEDLEAAPQRLTRRAVTGPPVDHNVAEQRSGFLCGARVGPSSAGADETGA